MKKILSILCSLIIYTISYGQPPDEIAIRNAMNEQLNAWNKGDVNAFMQTYWKSDSLLFVSSPPTYGWQKTLDHYKQTYSDTAAMGKLSFNLLELKQLSPEYYFVVGSWYLKRSIGDVSGYFTLLFRKINNQWVIIVDHSS